MISAHDELDLYRTLTPIFGVRTFEIIEQLKKWAEER